MSATEAGVAYTRILPSMQGFSAEVTKGLKSGLKGPTSKAGNDAGRALSKGITSGVDGSGGKLRGAASRVGDIFKAGLAGAGIAGAALLTAGLAGALDAEAAEAKLVAQLGGGQWAEETAQVAGRLYGQAFGDSVGDTAAAVKQVLQSGVLAEDDLSTDSIEKLTAQALTFSDVLDQDLNMSLQAVDRMLASGLAGSAEEAFDVLTSGIQSGVDRSGDLTETFQEYSTIFRDIGLSGADATGLLSLGLQAGARDADTVADSLKEFAIRAQDGSKLSAEGFAAIGLSAQEMTAAVAQGGPAARDALDQVLKGLQAMEDPAERNAAAVALFGTKAEDLGDSLFSLDLDRAGMLMQDSAGATEDLGSAYDTAKTKIESFKRQGLQKLTEFVGGSVIPAVERLAEVIGPVLSGALGGAQKLIEAINFDQLAEAWTTFKAGFDTGETFGGGALFEFAASLGVVAGQVVSVLRDDLLPAMQAGAAMLGQVWAEQGPTIMAALGQVVAIVGDAVGLIVAAISAGVAIASFIWQEWGAEILSVASAAWSVVGGVIMGALDIIQGIIRTVTAVLQGDWSAAWDGIKQVVDGAWQVITSVVQGGIDLIKGIASLGMAMLATAMSAAWDGVRAAVAAGWAAITDRFRRGFDSIKLAARVGWMLIKTTFITALTEVKAFVKGRIDDIVGFFKAFGGRIRSSVSNLASAIKAPFASAFNAIRRLWNRTAGGFGFSIPDWVPGVGGRSFKIPSMHTGGMVPGPAGSEHLRVLEGGEGVFTRDQMAAIGTLGTASSPGRPRVLIQADGLDEDLLRWLRRSVRAESGGDVQEHFGKAAA